MEPYYIVKPVKVVFMLEMKWAFILIDLFPCSTKNLFCSVAANFLISSQYMKLHWNIHEKLDAYTLFIFILKWFLISLFYTRCILYEFQYILIIRRGCICKNKVVLKHEILRESQYNIFITEGRISALFCNFFTSVFTVA